MNFKKFISGVSALTIAASAFAGMAVTASAKAEEIDYIGSSTKIETYDGYAAENWTSTISDFGNNNRNDSKDSNNTFRLDNVTNVPAPSGKSSSIVSPAEETYTWAELKAYATWTTTKDFSRDSAADLAASVKSLNTNYGTSIPDTVTTSTKADEFQSYFDAVSDDHFKYTVSFVRASNKNQIRVSTTTTPDSEDEVKTGLTAKNTKGNVQHTYTLKSSDAENDAYVVLDTIKSYPTFLDGSALMTRVRANKASATSTFTLTKDGEAAPVKEGKLYFNSDISQYADAAHDGANVKFMASDGTTEVFSITMPNTDSYVKFKGTSEKTTKYGIASRTVAPGYSSIHVETVIDLDENKADVAVKYVYKTGEAVYSEELTDIPIADTDIATMTKYIYCGRQSSNQAVLLDNTQLYAVVGKDAKATLTSVDYDAENGKFDEENGGTAVSAAVLNITVENDSAKVAVKYGENTKTTEITFSGDVQLGVIVPYVETLTTDDFEVSAVY